MKFEYSPEPEDRNKFTEQYNNFYSRFSSIYDWLVKILPVWRNWIGTATPWIQGPRVLEASFGTGYLLSEYAGHFESYGIDYNQHLAIIALNNLRQSGLTASLQVADVEALPYPRASFDTVINTMAFTGYPDGQLALSEISRVLRPSGRIVMVDISFPQDGNRLGTALTNAWKAGGDIIRHMPELFERFGFEYTDREVGGYGSVHLYVATKPGRREGLNKS
jgi:ubiquinone/menaquinone biosynthesis C-methylase UbiE